jgi:2,3-bisphosphoglycerate-independent phosphoglycerate mutase
LLGDFIIKNMVERNKVVLIIRDGWGYRQATKHNYIAAAKTPNEDRYLQQHPHGLLQASGEAVGLSKGYQGNSEVGHLTLGSGRIIFQALEQINQAIANGEFFNNQALLKLINYCQKKNQPLHLITLLQTQGVHAHLDHLLALLDLCQQEKFSNILIHVITDGRDAPVTESLKHLRRVNRKMAELGIGKIATISGRYYAMDRDQRWARTKLAYQAIAQGQGREFIEPIKFLKACHQAGETDEFIKPSCAKGYQGIESGAGVIFVNFRTDRTRQLTQALSEPQFAGFKRQLIPLKMVSMTNYYQQQVAKIAFPNQKLTKLLGEVVAQAGLRQLRISETEKYAHVTFFFNGQKEVPFQGEDRILIKSPQVATYDLQPEMSAPKISHALCREIKTEKYDLIIVNLVNGDMVGHTAKHQAIIKAIEAVDKAQGEIVKAALAKNYTCLLLADHGNAEDKGPKTMTSHTTNPVPVILVSNRPALQAKKFRRGGGLQDVAPTILALLGLNKPREMTGENLLS